MTHTFICVIFIIIRVSGRAAVEFHGKMPVKGSFHMIINMQDTALGALFGEKAENASIVRGPSQKGERKTFFAGDLNLDPIADKKKKAQQKAMKVVEDAWKQDQAITDSIAKREDHYAKLKDEVKTINEEIGRLNDKEADLMEEYKIDPDSQEQKDLELLEKRQDVDKGLLSRNSLTEEDQARLKELDQKPLTEYQERALAAHDAKGVFMLNKAEYEKQMKDDMANVRAIQLEALKHNPMVGAQKEVEEIYKQLSDEIIGMIRQDGVDHLDEVQEENEEKAEETKEKEKEQKEEIAEKKEQRAIEAALRTGTEESNEKAKAIHRQNEADMDVELDAAIDYDKLGDTSGSVSKSLDEIKNSMNLLEADLKGIQVDEEV